MPDEQFNLILWIVKNIILFFTAAAICGLKKLGNMQMKNSYAAAQFVKAYFFHFLAAYLICSLFSAPHEEVKITLISVPLLYLFVASVFVLEKFRNGGINNKNMFQLQDDAVVAFKEQSFENGAAYEVPEYMINNLTRQLPSDEMEIIKSAFTVRGLPGFLRRNLLLPEEESKGELLIFQREPLEKRGGLNEYLDSLHLRIKLNGFLLVKYLPHRDDRVIPVSLWNIQGTISRAEMWGRIHYAGFEVLNEIICKGSCYILAQRKGARPPRTKRPHAFIIKLRRVGYKGNIFFAYKLRTMFPYSEFIQEKLYELNSLNNSGKIAEDFRVTPLGKFLRRYWLDEIPQVINWLRGDIKLIGVRGMSLHYYSLYPDYYRKAFELVKPGLIPPVFDESCPDFNSIVHTEYKYLTSYIKAPAATDWKCFFVTLKKIVVKGYRGN